jgi:hypothetical protein
MTAPEVTDAHSAPPLPDDLAALLRRLRLPHIRRVSPDVLATAKAHRWEPAEVLRALLKEELAGRERSSLSTRRKAAGFPTGKTFEAWEPTASSIPAPTQQSLRTLEWLERRPAWRRALIAGPTAPLGLNRVRAPGPRLVGCHVRRSKIDSVATVPSSGGLGASPTSERRNRPERTGGIPSSAITRIGIRALLA